jgi:hypothetical protein
MHPLSERCFREILFADLTHATLVIPTDVVAAPRHSNPLGLNLPRRIYGEQGYLFQGERQVGIVQGLQLQPIFPADSPFTVSKRLSIGTPLSFELSSKQAIPAELAAQALFFYRFKDESRCHYGVFQDIAPRFVRIYPRKSSQELPLQRRQFHLDTQEFQRYERYRQLRTVDREI